MVSANQSQGDGLVRNIAYASWRNHEPSPGYSKELISDKVDPKYYDNLLAQPSPLGDGMDTLFKVYRRNVQNNANS